MRGPRARDVPFSRRVQVVVDDDTTCRACLGEGYVGWDGRPLPTVGLPVESKARDYLFWRDSRPVECRRCGVTGYEPGRRPPPPPEPEPSPFRTPRI